MANPTVLQNALWGLETTPGTPTTVTKYLGGISVGFAPQSGEAEVFRPEGSKFATFVVPSGIEHTQVTMTGKPTYNELAYIFCGLLKNVSPSGASTGKTWVFEPSYNAVDTRKTYTIDRGTTSRAERVAYVAMTGLSMTFRRQAVEMSATAIGYAVSDTAGISNSPSAVTIVPLQGKDVTFYMTDSQGTLPGTALTDVFQIEFNYTDSQGPVWIPKKAQTGFKETVDFAPNFGGTISIEKNATGEALRTTMRAGSKKWLRIYVADDSYVEGSTPYSLTMDLPIYLTNPGDQQDQDGVFSLGFNFVGAYDATWTKALSVTLVNTLAAL